MTNIEELMKLGSEAFIRAVYVHVLGRQPDEDGLKHYLRRLGSGKGKLSVLCDIAGSPEGVQRLGNNGLLTSSDRRLINELVIAERKARSFLGLFHLPNYLALRLNLLEHALGASYHEDAWRSRLDYEMFPAQGNRVPIEQAQIERNVIFAVRITGGIGDAVIIARFIRDFLNYLGSGASFDVYFHSPEVVRIFFAELRGFRAAIHEELLPKVVMHYDFTLLVNQFVTFANEHIKFERLLSLAPRVLEIFSRIEDKRRPIEKYIQQHPNLDGAFADLAVKSGHKRHTYLHHMAGLAYGGDSLQLALRDDVLEQFGFGNSKYITIHDGWDTKFKFKKAVHRPTKALPKDTWAEVVEELKKRYPEMIIVQIGGATGSVIDGVDICLKEKLSLEQSVSVIAGAILHVDAESGLVHIASAVGVRSVVVFGPTNVDWFGYARNENIRPVECGNCWWSTDTWMESCPAEHSVPLCMSSHAANLILSGFEEALSEVPLA